MEDSSLRGRASVSYNRRRAGNACLVCRARKTKCDNQRPICGFCAATAGNCQYVDSDPSHFDRASLAILQRLGQLESNLIRHIDDSMRQNSSGLAHVPPAFTGPYTNPTFAGSVQNSNVDVQSTTSPSNAVGTVASSGPPPTSTPYSHDGLPIDLTTDDLPPSSAVVMETSNMFLDSILSLPVFIQAVPHLEVDLCMSSVEALSPLDDNPGRNTDPSATLGSALLDLDSSNVSRLVENFLANNHVKNPILDTESLRKDAREFAEAGPQWNGKTCLILLVCAVSILSAPLHQELNPGPAKDPEKLALAEAFFQASQRRIGMLYHQNTLLAVQCSFLTAAYLMMTMQILAAWKCFVQAGVQCLGYLKSRGRMTRPVLPLTPWHFSTPNETREHGPSATRHDEDSLYWSCLKSELELRFLLGLPGSGLNETSYPTLFPSPPSPVHSTDDILGFGELQWRLQTARHKNDDRQNLELGWFFYLGEIALKRIIHNVASFLYKNKRTQRQGESQNAEFERLEAGAAEFEIQIRDWYAALPPPMKFPLENDQPTGDILRFILRGHMLDIREVIRLPAIHAFLSSAAPIVLEECSSTYIRLVQEILHNAVERIKANREGWYHRHQGTWLMMRSCSRSATHLLGTALKLKQSARLIGTDAEALEHIFLPANWKEAIAEVFDLLDYWSEDSRDIGRLSYILKELMRSYDSALV